MTALFVQNRVLGVLELVVVVEGDLICKAAANKLGSPAVLVSEGAGGFHFFVGEVVDVAMVPMFLLFIFHYSIWMDGRWVVNVGREEQGSFFHFINCTVSHSRSKRFFFHVLHCIAFASPWYVSGERRKSRVSWTRARMQECRIFPHHHFLTIFSPCDHHWRVQPCPRTKGVPMSSECRPTGVPTLFRKLDLAQAPADSGPSLRGYSLGHESIYARIHYPCYTIISRKMASETRLTVHQRGTQTRTRKRETKRKRIVGCCCCYLLLQHGAIPRTDEEAED